MRGGARDARFRRVPAGTALEVTAVMPSTLVTCPESGHLEDVEYEEDELGMLIASCTADSPPCTVSCARTCAARFDRRRRTRGFAALEADDDTLVLIRL